MTGVDILYALLELIGGIGVFLYGMKLMGDSLENVAGNKIKLMFNKISNKKLVSVGIGSAVSAVIQSSAAVTVMLVGFVNSGMMTLSQATPIIFGANIGTTITAHIVALGYGGVKNIDLMTIFASAAGVGAFMVMFSKTDKIKKIGGIITGLGMIFVGLAVMDGSMSVFNESVAVSEFIKKISNPLLLIIFGMLFTALIQSSSATSGIVITMTAVGMLDFYQGMYIILGSNIGTCITALLAAIGSGVNARRTAVMHLMFNFVGVLIFGLSSIFIPYEKLFTTLFNNPQTQIAMLHTVFNLSTVAIMLPFSNLMVKLVIKLVPERRGKRVDEDAPHFYYIEHNMLRTPPIAVAQLKKEIKNMADIAKINFDIAVNALTEGNINDIPTLNKNEKILNFLNRELTKFLVMLSHADIPYEDKMMIGTTYHTVSDIERIGDYAENISEYAIRMNQEGMSFSEEAVSEIKAFQKNIDKLYENVIKTYTTTSLEFMSKINEYEDAVDKQKEQMEKNHIERLTLETCTPETGAIYLSFASDAERVADHMTNIAFAVKSYAKPRKITPIPQKR